MKTNWKIAGVNFDHFHMGDLLQMVHEHPHAEIAAICDEQPMRMQNAVTKFGISDDRVFTDVEICLDRTKPDIVILCPATADHAIYTERVARYEVHILMEKPFAADLAAADRMIAAVRQSGKQLLINWPLRWYPVHVTARRILEEGRIGEVREVHYYDGNRGPLRHGAGKVESDPGSKAESWFYMKDRGGGSMLDYLGYGVTFGTWFHNGRRPLEITAVVDDPPGLEVDEHSITIARYEYGLSRYETRWGTFTDPWTHQPQPKCGFVIKGTAGTLSSYDFEPVVRMQTEDRPAIHELPVDKLSAAESNPIQYFIDCLESGRAVEGPLSPEISRIGQEMVDAAVRSAADRRTIQL